MFAAILAGVDLGRLYTPHRPGDIVLVSDGRHFERLIELVEEAV